MRTSRAEGVRDFWILACLGLGIAACYAGMVRMGDLRQETVAFLCFYGLAFLLYGIAVWGSLHWTERRRTLILVWGLALAFRVTLLFSTPPTLSDDVYRYIWDGRLANHGISPYALPVDSPLLNDLDSPLRALVNNNWMASPYLPTAQGLFALVYRLVPDSALAFQIAAMLLDLLTGLFVFDLMRRLSLAGTRVLICLWNPLVVIEFAHGAHVDSLMLCLMMSALWALIVARSRIFSVILLAAATLTKGLPALLLPVVAGRWGWRYVLAYAGLIGLVLGLFALGPGWGLAGPLDGTGLFGALRIYSAYWNYNGGIYHWLEVALSGYPTSGPVPLEVVGLAPIRTAKLMVAGALGLVLVAVWWRCRRCDDNLALLRLAAVPLGAYLLLATTVHPWYAALIIPFLPFLTPRAGEDARISRFLLPALYFSAAVGLSYTRYMDPPSLREYDSVRLVEYLPVYLMLAWAAWPASDAAGKPGEG